MSDQHIARATATQPYDSAATGIGDVPPRRPVGVTVLAVFSLLLAALGAINLVKNSLGDTTLLGRVLSCFGAFFIAMFALMGIGLWKQSYWARDTALWIFGTYAALHLLDFFSRPLTTGEWAVILISTGIFVYLLIPTVYRRFW